MRQSHARLATVLAVLACASALLVAQPEFGSLSGHISDLDGPLPGAMVTAAAHSWSATAVANSHGDYQLSAIPAGSYTVWFSLPGFVTDARSAVSVRNGEDVTLNAQMQVAYSCDDCSSAANSTPNPRVRIDTTLGSFTILVSAKEAPLTAANFLRYVGDGFYDSGQFHRATRADNYVVNLPNRPLLECVQAGVAPDRKAEALPPIPLERTTVTRLRHVVGTVSMARGADADTATSDFFILLNDQPSLDFGGRRFDDGQGAAAFGRVDAGMDVVLKIQQQPTEGQALKLPVAIISAKRVQ
jgi:peptidyl-prolyl cis-trans isomerase A (cyclophilin A)